MLTSAPVLGLRPIPVLRGLTVNTPEFPSVTLNLGGHELHIRAVGAPEKSYIQNIVLDGTPVRSLWLDWERVKKASLLEFTLSAEPSKEIRELPPSFEPLTR